MSTSFPQIDKSKYYTKTETHALLDALALGEYEFANAYYNKDYIDELGEQYYLKAEVDALIAAIEGGAGGGSYTNATPVPTTVGGITAGSTFDNVPVTDVITQLLYPYQVPAFTAFAIAGQGTTLEVGQAIPAGLKTFTWSTSNSGNVNVNSITIDDVTGNTELATGVANVGSSELTVGQVVKTSATNHTWRIEAVASNGSTIGRNFVVNWQWKVYYGESALGSLTEADVEALRVGILKTSVNGTYVMNEGGYKWWAFPSSFTQPTQFKDINTQFLVAMDPVVSEVLVTNSFGISTMYKLYRSYNILGGGIDVQIS